MSLKPRVSKTGTKGYGPSSPVQKALGWAEHFFSTVPMPDVSTDRAQANGTLIATHLLHLIRGCGLLNGTGYHSAAVSLLRAMEDALDCFAAVAMVKGAAEEWDSGDLKASDAAKQWAPLVADIFRSQLPLPDYRKSLRRDFNIYSHCSRQLCNWNLFFEPDAKDATTASVRGTLTLNTRGMIIDSNGHAIDAFETAHLLEFLELIRRCYSHALSSNPELLAELDVIQPKVVEIMEKHNAHHCQEVREPPELARLHE